MVDISVIRNYIKHKVGFHTDRRIIVLESDDWGSIRMPSKDVYIKLKSIGFNLDIGETSRYSMNDTIATSNDLSDLFEVLTAVRDINGNHCIMTPIILVANPDFDKIKENNFTNYYYKPFVDTFKEYPGCETSFELWKEGINRRIFMPQFHGREHLNVTRWIRYLKDQDRDIRIAFDLKMWSIPFRHTDYVPEKSLQAAFYYEKPEELELLNSIIIEGLDLFENLVGYKASYFVPPNGPLSTKLEKTLADKGIKYIQSARMIYKEPRGNGRSRLRFRYMGKKNALGQIYMIRNCFFEPSGSNNVDWVDRCLNQIKAAFKYRMPAIIISHRVNFIGSLNKKNKEKGLRELKELLIKIGRIWPDVEFLSSEKLGELIVEN